MNDKDNRIPRRRKRHVPYRESDHVLNIAYNALTGGVSYDDIALPRNDGTYPDALGAPRIPAPTTAGDFTRRFSRADVVTLMDATNSIRVKLWRKRLPRKEHRLAIILRHPHGSGNRKCAQCLPL